MLISQYWYVCFIDTLARMVVLITGCNGLVGCRLAKIMVDNAFSVFGISKHGLTNPYITQNKYFQMDICDVNNITVILDKVKPDVVIHAAAITKPDVCELNKEYCCFINLMGTQKLIEETQKRNIYTIHLSTDFVFSGTHKSHDENSTDFPPVNTYGQTKYEAEKYILENHPRVAIVRTALVYGYEPLLPRNNIFTWAVDELKKGNPIRVVDDQFRTPTFSDDLANGIKLLANKKLHGIFHIAGRDFMSVYEFVCLTADVFGFDKKLITPVKTSTLNELAKRPPSTQLNITKSITELHYKPHSTRLNIETLFYQYQR